MTSIVGGGGSSAEYQAYTESQQQLATETLNINQQKTDSLDSLSSARPLSAGYADAYINPPSRVNLPQPDPKASNASTAVIDGLLEAQQGAKANVQDGLSKIDQSLGKLDVFYEALNNQINNISEQDLESMAFKAGVSTEDVKELLLSASTNPGIEVPENLATVASSLSAAALSQAQELFGDQWTPASMAWVQDTAIMIGMQNTFAETVSSIPGLSKDDVDQLHFAMENPDAVDSLPPKLKAIFQQIMGKVQAQAKAQYGASSNWQFPPDKSGMSLTMAFDAAFETAIHKKVDSGDLSEKQAALLETLHYDSDANLPHSSELKKMLKEIESPVLERLQSLYGFPSGYRPKPNDRSDLLNLVYQGAFNQNLDAYSPPLTGEEKDLIRAASAPGSPSLSSKLEKIAGQIKALSTKQVASEYALPDDWGPSAVAVANPANLVFPKGLIGKMMNHLKEAHAIAEKTVRGMPPSDMKGSYMSFLSVVSSTLVKLSEVLTQTQVAQGTISKQLSQIRLDSQLSKIKKQQEMLEEMQEKQEKGGFLGFLTDCFNWAVNIVIIVAAPWLAIPVMMDANSNGMDMQHLNIIDQSFKMASAKFGQPLGAQLMSLFYVAMAIASPLFIVVILADMYIGGGGKS